MLRLYKIASGRIQEIPVTDVLTVDLLKQADWIDAQEPDEDERALLATLFSDEVPDIEDVEEIEASARCFTDQDGLHVHSMFLGASEESSSPTTSPIATN